MTSPNDNWLDMPDEQAVSQLERDSLRPAFRTAVGRALSRQRDQQSRALKLRRLALATAAALLLLVSGGVGFALYALISPVAVEAGMMQGLQGSVLSAFDMQPVPGVEVRKVRPAAPSGGELAATTNAQGLFNLPPVKGEQARSYELWFDGRRLIQFETGDAKRRMRGYREFIVDAKVKAESRTFKRNLKPGETVELVSGVRVSLDPAAKAWQGSFSDDKQWPSNFLFGQIVGGIYKLHGPACGGLRLSAYVSADVLRYYDAKPEELQVITCSQAYRDAEASRDLGPHELEYRSSIHRGWYIVGRPPAEYAQRLGLDPQQPQIEEDSIGRGGAWISWEAQPGAPYALLLPPHKDGKAVACWVDRLVSDEKGNETRRLIPAVRVIDRRRAQPLLYEVTYHDPGGMDYVFPEHYYMPSQECWFTDIRPRGISDRSFTLDFIKLFQEPPGSVRFTVSMLDFTTENRIIYDNITNHSAEPPRQYNIVSSQPQRGDVSTLRITGSTKGRIASIQWDRDSDNVIDAFSDETELVDTRGSYQYVRAVVYEKSGTIVLVDRVLYIGQPSQVSYMPDQYWGWRVMECNAAAPMPEASLGALSVNSVASPIAYGISAGTNAGPALFIQPPQELQHKALREIRIELYAQAVFGDALPGTDAGQMDLTPEVYISHPTGNSMCAYTTRGDFPIAGGEVVTINDAGQSCIARDALEMLESGAGLQPVYSHLIANNGRQQGHDTFLRATGINTYNLPALPRLKELLEQYVNGPYFAMRYAGLEPAKIAWRQRLWGLKLEDQDGLLVRIMINDRGLPVSGEWRLYSGGKSASRITIVADDGSTSTAYLDYKNASSP